MSTTDRAYASVYGGPALARPTQPATSASGSLPGGARKPIGRPGTNGSPTGCPGPIAFCAAAKTAAATDDLTTPSGVAEASGGAIA